MRSLLALALAIVVLTSARAAADEGYRWALPTAMARPVVPADNPMSEAKAELGRYLFYDKRLSANGTIACATCHQQAHAFSDPRVVPVGVTGEKHPRHAMRLANVAYMPVLTWANPRMRSSSASGSTARTATAGSTSPTT